MRDLIETTIAAFKAIPNDLISYIARIGVGTTFFRSGMLKLDGWADGNTLTLFREEYRLPLIPPEIAAYLATAAELTLPVLLFAGLFTRFASAGPARDDAGDRDLRLPQCVRHPRRVGRVAAFSDEIRRRVPSSLDSLLAHLWSDNAKGPATSRHDQSRSLSLSRRG